MDTIEQVLARHQRAGMGLSGNSPDTCTCGERVYPDKGEPEISLRRDVAFASHQNEQLKEAVAGLFLTAADSVKKDKAIQGLSRTVINIWLINYARKIMDS